MPAKDKNKKGSGKGGTKTKPAEKRHTKTKPTKPAEKRHT